MSEKHTEVQLLAFKEQHEAHRNQLIEMVSRAEFIQSTEYSDADDDGFETVTLRLRR